ncbi:unnamed protein product [Cuscuta europaea]|nr:unnamed protein product [Cuscuta europaea]
MGAPKQKWTPEEEAALKAGVRKHGPGKWRTILKDPDYCKVLYLRSNVDLKDKWRNMTVMANGWGSREKSKLALKRVHRTPKQDESSLALTNVDQSEDESSEDKQVETSSGSPRSGGTKRSVIRLDNLVMEAIINLKEPRGSSKKTIAAYIEDQYWAPPKFKRLLSAKLKYLTATGKLVKMSRKYRMAPPSSLNSNRKMHHPILLPEGRDRISLNRVGHDVSNLLTKSEIDLELAKMRSMTPQEAAAAAAEAVAEAEAAVAEAEQAAREAEAAEADAEAAVAFANAAKKTIQGRSTPNKMMIRT